MFSKNKRTKKSVKIGDLEKGVEKRERDQLIIKEKQLKPTTQTALKAVRMIVWMFLIALVLIGAYQLVVSKRPKIVQNIVKYEFAESEGEKAKALAENFARDYLTYASQDDYGNRIKEYTASGLILDSKFMGQGKSEVLNTTVWSVEKLDDNHSNIVIKVDTLITDPNRAVDKYDEAGAIIKVPAQFKKTYYLSVPIGAKDGRVSVDDYPAFVTGPELANVDMETYSSDKSLEDADENEVKNTLTDFLAVYYSGTEGQIKAFFAIDPKLRGLNGDFAFSRIVNFQGYGDSKTATAIVVVESTEKELGTIFYQRYLFEMSKAQDRWVINKMINRGMEVINDEKN